MPGDRIFISYRRGIDNDSAGRLYDRLEIAFGEGRLFRDVDASRDMAGLDFHEIIESRVSECSAFVAVLGRGWMESTDRLRSENDFVRIEIEAALNRDGIRVIPVLIEDAQMPAADDLPEALRSLTRRGAVRLTNEGYSGGIEGLTDILQPTTEPDRAPPEAAAPDKDFPPSPVPTPATTSLPDPPGGGPDTRTDRSAPQGVGQTGLLRRLLLGWTAPAVALPLIAGLVWFFGPLIVFGDVSPLESIVARGGIVAGLLLLSVGLLLRRILLLKRKARKTADLRETDGAEGQGVRQVLGSVSPRVLGRAQFLAGLAICALSAAWLLSAIVLRGEVRTLREDLLELPPAGAVDEGWQSRLSLPPSQRSGAPISPPFASVRVQAG